MSKLYLKAFSDARQTELTSRGHRNIYATIYYGSKENSKQAGQIQVCVEPDKKTYLYLKDDNNSLILRKELL